MNVLMITPRIDPEHDVLGFLYGWAKKLAAKVDKLIIVSLKSPQLDLDLGENVKLYSLQGSNTSIFFKFNKIIPKILREEDIDVIFTQMYLEFALAVYPYARLYRKPIITWYAHGNVDAKLKLVHKLVHRIVTSSPEGCRINSSKVTVIGQGIDTDEFRPESSKSNYILSVGRISPSKHIEVVIRAMPMLIKEHPELKLILVGKPYGPGTDEYLDSLRRLIYQLNLQNNILYEGSVPHSKIVDYYRNCNIFVTASTTGSLDKVTLEAMSCGVPVVVCNEAFKPVLGKFSDKLMFQPDNSEDLALKVSSLLKLRSRQSIKKYLRDSVIDNHSIDNLINNLVYYLYEAKNAKPV